MKKTSTTAFLTLAIILVCGHAQAQNKVFLPGMSQPHGQIFSHSYPMDNKNNRKNSSSEIGNNTDTPEQKQNNKRSGRSYNNAKNLEGSRTQPVNPQGRNGRYVPPRMNDKNALSGLNQ